MDTRRSRRQVSHAPISVNRPGVEFYVVSSDQGRPQSRPRRARSAVAPPSSSRRAVPRYICRRCVVHALTRVKLFLDRTWASLVQLQRTGPFVSAIYQSLFARALIPAICFTTFSQGKGYCFIRVSSGTWLSGTRSSHAGTARAQKRRSSSEVRQLAVALGTKILKKACWRVPSTKSRRGHAALRYRTIRSRQPDTQPSITSLAAFWIRQALMQARVASLHTTPLI
jgi:hypothetical protein